MFSRNCGFGECARNVAMSSIPSILSTPKRTGSSGARNSLPGGAAYRLAIIVDNIPEEECRCSKPSLGSKSFLELHSDVSFMKSWT